MLGRRKCCNLSLVMTIRACPLEVELRSAALDTWQGIQLRALVSPDWGDLTYDACSTLRAINRRAFLVAIARDENATAKRAP
jgi:hypothetical protein